MTAKAESQCVLKHEWHSSRCAIRLLGMEKKKKEKDGEANEKTISMRAFVKDFMRFTLGKT